MSQAILFITMLLCVLIMPNVAAREGGVSNFGNHASTVSLYSLGFLANIVFLYMAARLIVRYTGQVGVSVGLKLLSLGTLVVFLSTFPRYLGAIYSDAHDLLGIILYGYYFSISVWVVVTVKRSTLLGTLLVIQTIGSIVGLLSALKIVHALFIGQLVASFAFGGLLCIGLPWALKRKVLQS